MRGPGHDRRRHGFGDVRGDAELRALRVPEPAACRAGDAEVLRSLAARLPGAFGFDNGFFNAEFVVPDSGPAMLIELNGRIASQFAPLLRAVHGPLELRRAARARLRRGPALGSSFAERRGGQLRAAALRGRVRRRVARAGGRRRDPRPRRPEPLRRVRERSGQLPAGDRLRGGRDARGGGRRARGRAALRSGFGWRRLAGLGFGRFLGVLRAPRGSR